MIIVSHHRQLTILLVYFSQSHLTISGPSEISHTHKPESRSSSCH